MADEEKPIEKTLTLKDIQAERVKLMNQALQVAGAIQAYDHLIDKLTTEEKKDGNP